MLTPGKLASSDPQPGYQLYPCHLLPMQTTACRLKNGLLNLHMRFCYNCLSLRADKTECILFQLYAMLS
jgi:hypothetical protein